MALSTAPPAAPSCGSGTNSTNCGSGGSISAAPGGGFGFQGDAGSGGAVGRLLVTTVGDCTTNPGTIISAASTTAALVPQ